MRLVDVELPGQFDVVILAILANLDTLVIDQRVPKVAVGGNHLLPAAEKHVGGPDIIRFRTIPMGDIHAIQIWL